jgi:hypothetical protein
VRERGTQSRRARASDMMDPSGQGSGRPPGGDPGGGQWRHWPLVAVIALVAATAGWTTVAVMVLDGRPAQVAQVSPSPTDSASEDVLPSDDIAGDSVAPQHDAPEMEALLPTQVADMPLTTESVLGSTYLGDDAWSTAVRAELTKAKKADDVLKIGVAYGPPDDPRQFSITVYSAEGVPTDALLKAMTDSYAGLEPPYKISKATIAEKPVTKAVPSDGASDSLVIYWYVNDGNIYDIETDDVALAGAAIAALPPVTDAPSVAPSTAAPVDSTEPSPS